MSTSSPRTPLQASHPSVHHLEPLWQSGSGIDIWPQLSGALGMANPGFKHSALPCMQHQFHHRSSFWSGFIDLSVYVCVHKIHMYWIINQNHLLIIIIYIYIYIYPHPLTLPRCRFIAHGAGVVHTQILRDLDILTAVVSHLWRWTTAETTFQIRLAQGPRLFQSGLNAGKDHWRPERHPHQEIDFWPSDHFRSRFQALWPVRWWKLSWATTGSRINGVLHDGKSPGWIYSQDMSRSHKHTIDLKQQSIKH